MGVLLVAACSSRRIGSDAAPTGPDAAPPPPRFEVVRLRVTDRTPVSLRPRPVPPGVLDMAFRDALVGAGVVFGSGADAHVWQVRIEVGVVYGLTRGEGLLATVEDGTARAWVELQLGVREPGRRIDAPHYIEDVSDAPFDAAAGPEGLDVALRDRVDAAAKVVAQRIAARLPIVTLDAAGLVEYLDDDDPDVRRAVVGRLGTLRAVSAVGALTKRLDEETDRDTLLRIVGALSEIKSDEAARALMDKADPKDREMLRAIVYALSAVGGERVADFLDLLGSHDSADVREMVDDARRRLDRGRSRRFDVAPQGASPRPGADKLGSGKEENTP